jgi:inosose dehydratase
MSVASRRCFLQTIGASAGLVAAGSASSYLARAAVLANVANEYGPFAIGMQSYTLRKFPVDKAIDRMQQLGIQTVEFFDAHYSSKSNDEQIAAMQQKLAGRKLQALSHGVHGFSKNHEANKRLFEFARRAGIRNLTADPTEDAFDSLDELVAEYDIRIAIHNHGPGARYDKIDSVLNAIKGRHANIGACADLGHFIRSGEDPVRAIQLFEGRLFGVHLKDFDAPRGDAKGCVLGQGLLDLPAVLKALDKVKFPSDACLALEYEEHPTDPVPQVQACLQATQDAAKKVFATSPD